MNLTTKEQFFKRAQRRYTTVNIAETGDNFRVQSLTEKEKSDYEATMMSKAGAISRDRLQDAYRRLFVLVVVDEAGNRMFSDDDLAALENVDSLVVARVFQVAHAFCGFEKNDIEDIIKNSSRIHVAG